MKMIWIKIESLSRFALSPFALTGMDSQVLWDGCRCGDYRFGLGFLSTVPRMGFTACCCPVSMALDVHRYRRFFCGRRKERFFQLRIDAFEVGQYVAQVLANGGFGTVLIAGAYGIDDHAVLANEMVQ